MNMVELSLGYAFNFPLTLSANTFVWGWDKADNNNNLVFDGKQLYSTYLEASYLFKSHILVFAGVSPYQSRYSNGFGLVNTGVTLSKAITIDKFVLPVKTSIVVNPYTKVVYGNVTFSF